MARQSPHINVMIKVAEKAGRALIRDFGEVEELQVSRKGPGDFVSAADLKSEKILKEELLKAYPAYGLLLEEGGEIKGSNAAFRWIIDPLDGTTNFLHGLPHWCISIALEREGEIIAGVIHDPIKNEIFYAEKGTGAFSGTKRLRVSGRTSLNDALVIIGDDTFVGIDLPSGCRMRRTGSACLDLVYVAAGRADAYWENGLQPWDKAAGGLIVKEAGGNVGALDGHKSFAHGNGILAANQTIYADLSKRLTAAQKTAKTAS